MTERIILVLGGGGVKGIAHVGAWKAIQEAGVEIAEIVGTSIGALAGAMISGGASLELMEQQARALMRQDIVDVNRWAVLPNGLRQRAVFRGEALRGYIERVLPVDDWSGLRLPLTLNAVDLETGEIVWFGAGGRTDVDLAEAIYASMALPIFYPPAELDGMVLVDGGVGDALPITKAADRGATRVIAVHASAGRKKDARDTVEKGMVAIHHRVFEIMAYERRTVIEDAWLGPNVVHVRPAVEDYSTFDFDAIEFFLDEGYRATKVALEDARRSAQASAAVQ